MKLASIIFALALSSCAGTGLQGTQTLVDAEKSLTIAHLAYNGIGAGLLTAANSGVLKGANAAQAKVYFDKAGDALKVADTADNAANASGILAAVQQAQDAIAQANALVNPKKVP